MTHLPQAPASPTQQTRGARRLPFAAAGFGLVVLLASAVSVSAMPGGAAEAGRLHSSLDRMTRIAKRQVRPPTGRLARELPEGADRLNSLRDPASTAETQVGIALGELQQMTALKYDPHYLPALIAAGRAFVAVTGQDPMTRTAINPEYQGLERELTEEATGMQAAGRSAGKALRGTKRLSRELIHAKRRANRLERQLRRLRARPATASR